MFVKDLADVGRVWSHRSIWPVLTALAVVATAGAAAAAALSEDALAFHQQLHAAMMTMMHDMEVAPSGDADRDFTAMMEPHHQLVQPGTATPARYLVIVDEKGQSVHVQGG